MMQSCSKIRLDSSFRRSFLLHPYNSPTKLTSTTPSPRTRFTAFPRIRAVQVSSPTTKSDVSPPATPAPRREARTGGRRKLTATVTIKRKHTPNIIQSLIDGGLDVFLDRGRQEFEAKLDSAGLIKVTLQLISTKLDPVTKQPKRSTAAPLKDWEKKANYVADKVEYTADFVVSEDFGLPGAIAIQNEHAHEFYLETISLEGWIGGKVYFPCYSWVHSKIDNPEKRIFFSNEVYLPEKTPEGLKELRETEMVTLRGDGRGHLKKHERIYDYAVYNDLGNPDKNKSLARPSVGGSQELPYPRRLCTGRSSTKTDPNAESVLGQRNYNYVPRDEAFEDLKKESYVAGTLKLFMHELLPEVERALTKSCEFNCFTEIDRLYKESMMLKEQQPDMVQKISGLFSNFTIDKQVVPRFLENLENSVSLRFSQPQQHAKDRFSWLRDDEFARQALAGVNPIQIELMKSFPPVSNLDQETYGPKESAIKAEHIEGQLGGLSIGEALDQKRLFMIDYHDAFLPFINKINEMKDRKMYASRSIFFLTELGTLTPVAIELSLPPPCPGTEGSKRVFTPGQDATSHWLWQLAKAHAASNDAGVHQLVNHWLRGHAAVEPYVIATHRQLSILHPISKLLQPHLRYTIEINALARQLLINADGVIENCFTPGHYSMDISSAVYKSAWRFDMENFPADVIRRGMAEEDPENPGDIKLVIEDYPYAADGVLIWNAIKDWVSEYVDLYYSDPESLINDREIHNWWNEIRYQGHGDKKDEPWWPELNTKEDLKSILCNIIWVTSAHHAAVNFGQYAYGGYIPNRPTMTRRLIPEQDENDKEYQELIQNPQKFFLSMISNKYQATYVMSVLDSLSTHASDEEYLGQRVQVNWTSDARAKDAASTFAKRIAESELIIDKRNMDGSLKNRNGVGVLPYELLRPTSGPGVTGRGIPNSVSI